MNEDIQQQVATAEGVYGNTLENIGNKMSFRLAAQHALGGVGIALGDSGIDNLPKKGPFLLISNHPSYLDPLIAAATGIFERRPDLIITTHLNAVNEKDFPGMHAILNNFWAVDADKDHPYLGAAVDDIEQAIQDGAGLFEVPGIGLDHDARYSPHDRAQIITERAKKTESSIVSAHIKIRQNSNGEIYMAQIEIQKARDATIDSVRAAIQFAYPDLALAT